MSHTGLLLIAAIAVLPPFGLAAWIHRALENVGSLPAKKPKTTRAAR